MASSERVGFRKALGWLSEIIGPDMAYVRLGLVYTLAISLLSLATPISVQLLINSVANIALPAPLWTLSGVLLLLLLLVVVLSAARIYLMAVFERRVFSRVVAEITLRAAHAQNPFFGDQGSDSLFNRYFDLTVVQKAVPGLVIGGFTVVLQGVVGLVVTSFYHPFFLAFNVVLVIAVVVVWLLSQRGATTGAVRLSHAKHDAAAWLESLAGSNGFYKSGRHLDFAIDRSEAVTATYVAAHRRYFRYNFAQALSYLLIWAFASAALLALGGNLILRGELSIGQLIAAELILSGVFYGIAQFGYYLDTFYDLVGSAEELSLLFAIPQEKATGRGPDTPEDGALQLTDVATGTARFDFSVAAGEQLIVVADAGIERQFAMLVKRHARPDRGLVLIGGADLDALDLYRLRSEVLVLDRPVIAEVTIREYLSLAADEVPTRRMMTAIKTVGLQDWITRLDDGLETKLAATGYPLDLAAMMALRLAKALITRPRLLVLGQVYDLLPSHHLSDVLAVLKDEGTSVLLFTRRPEDLTLDGWLHMGSDRQCRFDAVDDLTSHLEGREDDDVASS